MLAVVTVAVVGGSYLRWRPEPDGGRSRSDGYAATANREEVDRLIGVLEAEVRTTPSATRLTELGQLYLQRARANGDIRNYSQAEAAANRALELAATDLDARSLLASVRYTTHDFAGALSLAEGVVADDPSQVGALATVGDAHLELGAYGEAQRVYERLAAAKPDSAATSIRRARLAYLQGRPEDARRLAVVAEEQARATALGGASLSLYQSYHGQVEFDTGHYGEAAKAFSAALDEAPGTFVPLAGLARARAAQGRRGEAISLYEQAVAVLPDPAALAALGDLYWLDGKPGRADAEYGTVEVIGRLGQLNQQVYNRVLALFYADHDTKLDEAVRLSEGELQVRKDVFGYDAYAWALYKNARPREARDAIDKALAQRTVDPRLLYHAGMISVAVGDVDRATAELSRALAISPRFDPLEAPRAREALAKLSGRR
ncbi:MAG: tetratricopeptide repeat protein [Acidimicrobiales bacterium]